MYTKHRIGVRSDDVTDVVVLALIPDRESGADEGSEVAIAVVAAAGWNGVN